ncbi:uncharacterized protein LOC118017127 [Mirounga leonina]|uniref:uncharacterized protein LOC118017127 n=1 Tax=Mirounga leonina TaxID=9715 RepID=UPI00156BE55E|nr:uncharacterized protein LOC118017127 [Mirounga leonina]
MVGVQAGIPECAGKLPEVYSSSLETPSGQSLLSCSKRDPPDAKLCSLIPTWKWVEPSCTQGTSFIWSPNKRGSGGLRESVCLLRHFVTPRKDKVIGVIQTGFLDQPDSLLPVIEKGATSGAPAQAKEFPQFHLLEISRSCKVLSKCRILHETRLQSPASSHGLSLRTKELERVTSVIFQTPQSSSPLLSQPMGSCARPLFTHCEHVNFLRFLAEDPCDRTINFHQKLMGERTLQSV